MIQANATVGQSGNAAARLNALLAVELDPVRRHERVLDLRLGAAVSLAPTLIVAEALLAGVSVPASVLDVDLVSGMGLQGEVVLDQALALRVLAYGPLPESARRLRRAA